MKVGSLICTRYIRHCSYHKKNHVGNNNIQIIITYYSIHLLRQTIFLIATHVV
jgi:hypothetical protein